MTTSAASLYTDFSGLARMRAGAREGSQESKRAVAEQIEAMFIGMMLKSMRAGSDALGGAGGNMPRDLYDSQIAQHLAHGGSLGFAEMMLAEFGAGATQPAPGAVPDADSGGEAGFPAPERNMLLARALWHENGGGDGQLAQDAQAPFKPQPEVAAKSMEAARNWSSPTDFVRELMPAARQAAASLGTQPEAVLAVAALETGWGRHMPARSDGTPSYNLFGIKSHGWKGEVTRSSTLEFESGQFQRKVEPFRSYGSPEDAITDFAAFISTQPRYKAALSKASDPEAFLRGLHQAGYATDPRYGDKLVAMLNSGPLSKLQVTAAGGEVDNSG